MKPSELIRQRGWCQYALARIVLPDGKMSKIRPRLAFHIDEYSAAGAIKACKIGKETVLNLARNILKEKPIIRTIRTKSEAWLIIQAWNNEDGRTAEQVIAKLEEFGL